MAKHWDSFLSYCTSIQLRRKSKNSTNLSLIKSTCTASNTKGLHHIIWHNSTRLQNSLGSPAHWHLVLPLKTPLVPAGPFPTFSHLLLKHHCCLLILHPSGHPPQTSPLYIPVLPPPLQPPTLSSPWAHLSQWVSTTQCPLRYPMNCKHIFHRTFYFHCHTPWLLYQQNCLVQWPFMTLSRLHYHFPIIPTYTIHRSKPLVVMIWTQISPPPLKMMKMTLTREGRNTTSMTGSSSSVPCALLKIHELAFIWHSCMYSLHVPKAHTSSFKTLYCMDSVIYLQLISWCTDICFVFVLSPTCTNNIVAYDLMYGSSCNTDLTLIY